ncbi:uncharacterized protein PG986_005920 [Apiospora aurea]|uniref:Uncharacterized protein n=1 Tax=Apiospora aurea TaxID=335848 RepID=A0ABR1QJ96_9PEZI
MHAYLIALVSTVAAAAAAPGYSHVSSSSSSLIAAARDTPYAEWPAAHFAESCSPGGCFASFNISAPAGYVAGAPAFDVICHPVYARQDWRDCDNSGGVEEAATGSSRVQSMKTDASRRGLVRISVAHIWAMGAGSSSRRTMLRGSRTSMRGGRCLACRSRG